MIPVLERKAEIMLTTAYVGFMFWPFLTLWGHAWWLNVVLVATFVLLVERISNGIASLKGRL